MPSLIHPGLASKPDPWKVRGELITEKWRWLWPYTIIAIPFWENTSIPTEVVTDRLLTGYTPNWKTQPLRPVVTKPVASTITNDLALTDHAAYRRVTNQVTMMALVYRPTTGTAAPNYDGILGKTMAAPSYSSYSLFNESTTQYKFMFAVSTTTNDNNFTNGTNADVGNAWRWAVGRWISSTLISVQQYGPDGQLLVNDNGGALPAGGVIKYDTGGIYCGKYDGYYAAAYVFSRYLSDAQLRDIMRDPWGIVRPGYAVGTYATAAATGSGARSLVAGMIG